MSSERALNFDQWKTFSENYKPMRVWFWLVYKFTENYCRSWLFSKFIQTQEVPYLPWQNASPNLKTTCHIKLKFFLWTKLLQNLVLPKYLISVTAPLTIVTYFVQVDKFLLNCIFCTSVIVVGFAYRCI